jgi:hypothetical protein
LVGDFFFYFHFFVNHISRKEIGQFFFLKSDGADL